MKILLNPLVLICTLLSCLACGCSKPHEEVEIPIPSGISEADPLVAQLVTTTASEVRSDPSNVDLWSRYASVLLANAFYEESVQVSKHAIAMNPKDRIPLRYRQAITLWRLNQQDEAILQLTGVLHDEPLYDIGWRVLAAWHLERGNFEAAEEAINRAWDLAPKRLGTLATRVRILLQQERAGEAISLLVPRLNQTTTPPHLYFLAAQAYRRLGETESMEAAAAKGKPLPNAWGDPMLNDIMVLSTGKRVLAINALLVLKSKGPKAALPMLERAFAADPVNSQIRGAYAMVLVVAKQETKALQIIQGIEDPETAVGDYWLSYANISVEKAKHGDRHIWLPKAMEYFQKAETLTGGSPTLYRSMARLAIVLEKQDEASTYFQKGAQMLLDAGEIQYAKTFLGEGIMAIEEDEVLRFMLQSIMDSQ